MPNKKAPKYVQMLAERLIDNGYHLIVAEKYSYESSIRLAIVHTASNKTIYKFEYNTNPLPDISVTTNMEYTCYHLLSNTYSAHLFTTSNMKSSKDRLDARIKHIDLQIKSLQKERTDVLDRIDFMAKTGKDTFDERHYRAYKAIQVMESNERMSLIEKAERMAELMNDLRG